MKELGVFWFVPKSGVPNLGDEFGRIVLENIVGVGVVKKGLFSCDAISVGSILGWGWEKGGFKNRATPLSVLGSGLMHPNVQIDNSVELKVYGARGELTKAILANNGYDVLGVGDLGLLARDVLGKSSEFEKVHEVSFIPHHSRFDLYKKQLSEAGDLNLIDMRTYDYAYVLEEIAKSKIVVSESLHGLIFADSLRVPNVWFKRKDLHVGGGFKFKDYFSAVGRSSHKNVDKISDVSKYNIFDDWDSVDEGVKNTQKWLARFIEENNMDE